MLMHTPVMRAVPSGNTSNRPPLLSNAKFSWMPNGKSGNQSARWVLPKPVIGQVVSVHGEEDAVLPHATSKAAASILKFFICSKVRLGRSQSFRSRIVSLLRPAMKTGA